MWRPHRPLSYGGQKSICGSGCGPSRNRISEKGNQSDHMDYTLFLKRGACEPAGQRPALSRESQYPNIMEIFLRKEVR